MSTIPHEKTGYTGVLSQFSPNRFFELSGENTKAFRICLIKTRKIKKTSNINASRERWSADCCGKQNRYNHSKSADGNIMWVRVPPPAPARHKRHIACDELFIKAHRSLILLCLAFRPANASLLYRARELRNTKISELLPPNTSERACAAAPPLRIEPAASGFSLALGAGPKAAAPIRLQYNKRSEQSSPCSDLLSFREKSITRLLP